MNAKAAWVAGFQLDYNTLFVKKWSSYTGALLLVMVVLALMISGMVWGVFGGVKFWGDRFNNLIGLGAILGIPKELESWGSHRMSLMNMTLVLGAFCAALLSRDFAINLTPKI